MKKIAFIVPCVLLFVCVSSFRSNNESKFHSTLRSALGNMVYFNFVVTNSTSNDIETIITVDSTSYNTGPRDTGANSTNTIDGGASSNTNQTIKVTFLTNAPAHAECCGEILSTVNGSVTFTGISIPSNGDLGIDLF